MELDVIQDRIRFFLEYRHWSIYKLAQESSLSYSSVNNLLKCDTMPSIPTLSYICKGFGITMSEFFDFGSNPLRDNTLTEDEQEMLNMYRRLSSYNKEISIHHLEFLLSEKNRNR